MITPMPATPSSSFNSTGPFASMLKDVCTMFHAIATDSNKDDKVRLRAAKDFMSFTLKMIKLGFNLDEIMTSKKTEKDSTIPPRVQEEKKDFKKIMSLADKDFVKDFLKKSPMSCKSDIKKPGILRNYETLINKMASTTAFL